jgi:hypothetical protein
MEQKCTSETSGNKIDEIESAYPLFGLTENDAEDCSKGNKRNCEQKIAYREFYPGSGLQEEGENPRGKSQGKI